MADITDYSYEDTVKTLKLTIKHLEKSLRWEKEKVVETMSENTALQAKVKELENALYYERLKVENMNKKLCNYEGDQVITNVVILKNEVGDIFEKLGIKHSPENYDKVYNSDIPEKLTMNLVESGLEELEDLIRRLQSQLDDRYMNLSLYNDLIRGTNELGMVPVDGYEVKMETEDSHPELVINIQRIYDATVIEEILNKAFENNSIYSEEAELEVFEYVSYGKYIHVIFGENDIENYDRLTFILDVISNRLSPYVQKK